MFNEFFDFFFDCYGKEKSVNPLPYRSDSILAFGVIFRLIKDEGLINKTTAKKLGSYCYTAEYTRMPLGGKTHALVTHFNRGRKKKLPYSRLTDS